MKQAKRLDNADEILELPISYEEKGKEIGKEIGTEIGKAIGKELGKEIGREEAQNKIAVNLLRKGIDIEIITETTMLNTEEVEELKKQLD